MSRLSLTAEDMADLIAGHSINVPLEGGEEIIVAAPDGVNKDWDSAAPEPAPASRLVPDLTFEVKGHYQGNAYPEEREYEVRLAHDPADGIQMLVSDSGGAPVAKPLVITAELADGILTMSQTDHDLGGYEDDWTLPTGMGRSLYWVLQTDMDHHVQLGPDGIDKIADWLVFATDEQTWDWAKMGEVYES